MIKVGGQFSGVGAFDQALKRLGIESDNIYQAEWDKYARQTYLLNFEKPKYYVNDVYDTPIEEITDKHGSLDIAMFSPPCQSFSIAGKREGENSDKGILFYNSLEFITKNKPKFFIFENVKGLLSDNKGITFQNWCALLGGKSINGNANLFSYENSVPYHIYWQVLNAKDYNIPQNRERVFIVGIRDDSDNRYQFPKKERLTKKLKDILEENVDSKYYLSEIKINKILNSNFIQERDMIQKGDVCSTLMARDYKDPKCIQVSERGSVYSENTDTISCLTATDYKQPKQIQVGIWRTHKDDYGFRKTKDNNCPTILARAREDGSSQVVLKITTNTEKGFDILTENDSLNYSNPNSKTRRGRIGKGVAQTLDTGCEQAVIGAIRGRYTENPKSRVSGLPTTQMLEINENETFNTLTTVQKDNVVVTDRIRRLTPLECFRAMDFNEDFKWNVSPSQAYKQAGNSICVGVLAKIIQNLPL